ncbi:MAG: type II toxin-antitoxin system RelE/ParE family toxin [Marmoricola sp.]
MTSRVFRVHPELLDDLREAIDHYRSQGDFTLPERFVAAYAEAVTHIEEHPLTGREYLPGYVSARVAIRLCTCSPCSGRRECVRSSVASR